MRWPYIYLKECDVAGQYSLLNKQLTFCDRNHVKFKNFFLRVIFVTGVKGEFLAFLY